MTNKRLTGLAFIALSITAIICISYFFKEDPIRYLVQYGKIVVLTLALRVVLEVLDRLKIIDLKKQHQENIEFERKLKKNKMNRIWLMLGTIIFFLLIFGTLFLFSEPSQTDSNVWEFKKSLFEKLKVLLFSSLYLAWGYVLFLGTRILGEDKSKKRWHFFSSLIIFLLFSAYLIGAYDSPNLLLVCFMLCLSVTWVHFVILKVIKNLIDDDLKEEGR